MIRCITGELLISCPYSHCACTNDNSETVHIPPPPKPKWYDAYLKGAEQQFEKEFVDGIISGVRGVGTIRGIAMDDPYKQ